MRAAYAIGAFGFAGYAIHEQVDTTAAVLGGTTLVSGITAFLGFTRKASQMTVDSAHAPPRRRPDPHSPAMRRALVALALMIAAGPAVASGTIGYGSRAGMVVDIVSMSGLDTSHAVIHTHHSRENALAFCREYVGKVTAECIQNELSVRLDDDVTANCTTGEFVDFEGHRYRYAGPSEDKDATAKYRIIDVETGKDLSGDEASGYPTNAGIFGALCPRHAPDDDEFRSP